MFEENVTTLIGNKMTVDQWQSVYDSFIDDQGLDERLTEKNHVSFNEEIRWQYIISFVCIYNENLYAFRSIG